MTLGLGGMSPLNPFGSEMTLNRLTLNPKSLNPKILKSEMTPAGKYHRAKSRECTLMAHASLGPSLCKRQDTQILDSEPARPLSNLL